MDNKRQFYCNWYAVNGEIWYYAQNVARCKVEMMHVVPSFPQSKKYLELYWQCCHLCVTIATNDDLLSVVTACC
jgi:hypothetical protein